MKHYSSPNNSCLSDVLLPMRIGPMIRQLACAILLSVALAIQAQGAEPDVGELLQTSCIWSPSSPPGRQAYVSFRKDFDLPTLPDKAMLNIFADSRYILWINDAYVLRGPCRFDPKRPEYDSVDVRSFLRPGTNRMTLLVHHYAGGNNSKIIAHDPGLMAALVLPNTVIRTDSTWKSSIRTAYLPSPAAWGSIPDVIDGRIVSSETDWEAAIGVDGKKWGALQPRSIPLARETVLTGLNVLPSRQALASVLPMELTAGKELLVDVGRMAMAYTTVDLEADAGSVLQLEYALRYINGKAEEPYGVGTTYTTRFGRQNFSTGDEWGCHYATLRCVSGRIKLLGVSMTDRRYPFERLGRFSCNDVFLNRLWDMAVNTIEATSDDGYGSDARERNEWLQDPAQPNFITTRVALAGPGKGDKPVFADPRLLKNLLRHVALSQTPDGRLKGHALSDRWDCHGYIEDYACQWVESLRLYYDATGDKEFVTEMWPFLTKQMQWFLDHRTPHGLVLAREYTSFDDPLAYVMCEGTALNAFIFQAFRDASYLSHLVGGKSYDQDAQALAAAINLHLWNDQAKTYHSGFVKDALLGPTAHAALLALDRGVVPPDRIASVRQWFLANYRRPSGFHCGQNDDHENMVASRAGIGMPVTYYWVFQEFYRMDDPGMDVEALGEMRRRWAQMVHTSTDTGTLWESFTGPESCHNYGSVPAYFLSSFVLGVRLDGPVSNQRLVIEPRLGDLTIAQGVVVTEFGPVPVSWKREGQDLTFHFEVPKGIQATLRLPDGDAATLVMDGGKANANKEGRHVSVAVKEGTHQGRLRVAPAPTASPGIAFNEKRLSDASAPVVIIARNTEASQTGLEGDVAKVGLLDIASVTEEHVALEGGNPEALRNGTTRNGSGGDETLNDGSTYRAYDKASVLTFQLDIAKNPGGYDLAKILTFSGHKDSRASQAYTVLVASVADPAVFTKLATAALPCDGGASELRLCAKDAEVLGHHLAAVRFAFEDGPIGFNVYREINLVGQPAGK